MRTVIKNILFAICIYIMQTVNAQTNFRYTLFYSYAEKVQDDEGYQWPFNSKGTKDVHTYAAMNFSQFSILKSDTEAFLIKQPNSFFIDTLYIALGHENNSGKADTIIVKITDVDKNGMPGKKILWQQEKIFAKSLSKSNDWRTGYTHLLYKPTIEITGGKAFAVTFEYYGDKTDTLGLRALYHRDTTKAKVNNIHGEVYPATLPAMRGTNWAAFGNGKVINSCKDKDKEGNLSPVQHWDFYIRIRSDKNLLK